jgi:hypothetical protein
MRTETEDMIARFREMRLFKAVGGAIHGGAKRVNSWTEAARQCQTSEWESVHLQVNNLLAMRVSLADYSRLEAWRGPVIAAIKRDLAVVIERDVLPVTESYRLSRAFQNSVEWDLIEICLEVEFSDLCDPIFFVERVLPWYEAGHFPCGWDGPKLDESWEGPMPDGQLIVY